MERIHESILCCLEFPALHKDIAEIKSARMTVKHWIPVISLEIYGKLFCMRAVLISAFRSVSFITKLMLYFWKLSSKLIPLSGVLSESQAILFPVPLDTALIFVKTQCLVDFWLPLASYNVLNNGVDVKTGQ